MMMVFIAYSFIMLIISLILGVLLIFERNLNYRIRGFNLNPVFTLMSLIRQIIKCPDLSEL